ncbi:hypothetical protein UFOVP1344_38 [uncultured Caudovirales phage]|uniref:Uncharacterized protein n=1 Tax=uncultured Caudovirales phage TaxID=2100421 RepID=A0A6J5Q5M3_9CAUD|nr:hypothetical protein UFOVP1005_38 [uncultured Caudovirales phage]CAB4200290.1 hypothetical protein UFOVP1344_38 [uncultured Caudovirales phage]CAB4218060.1 hypothetical protein UFOVP1602_2 [uncultured Caudovirales phage]
MAKTKTVAGMTKEELVAFLTNNPDIRDRVAASIASGKSATVAVESAAVTSIPGGKRPKARSAGKVERAPKEAAAPSMRGASAAAQSIRQGDNIGSKAWKTAKASIGEEQWKTLSPKQKVTLALDVVPKSIGAAEAVGVVRAIGSRAMPLRGADADGTSSTLETWGKARGVKNPLAEARVAVEGKASGQTGRQIAQTPTRGVAGGTKSLPRPTKETREAKMAEVAASTPQTKLEKIVERATADHLARVSPEPQTGIRSTPKRFKEKQNLPKAPNGTKWITVGVGKGQMNVLVDTEGYVLGPKGSSYKNMTQAEYLRKVLNENAPAEPKRGPVSRGKGESATAMEALSASGARFNREFTVEAVRSGHQLMNTKIRRDNQVRLSKGASKDSLPQALTVRQYVDAAFPDIANTDKMSMVAAVRKLARTERVQRKADKMPAEPAPTQKRKTRLKPQTPEAGRAKVASKEVARVTALTRQDEVPARPTATRREKNAAKKTMRSVVTGTEFVPAEDAANIARKPIAKRAPKTPEINTLIDQLKKDMSPVEKKQLYEIKRVAESGFKPARVKAMEKAGIFTKRNTPVSPKVKTAAKALGYMNIAALALNFLDGEKKRRG